MDITIRALSQGERHASEWSAFLRCTSTVFGHEVSAENAAHYAAIIEKERTRCAFDGDLLVGTSGAYSLDLTVPGGTLPCGGTTIVTVLPTHRRRGVLIAMMRAHLDDVHQRGEPLAALWASEAPIYGRFGYGSAARAPSPAGRRGGSTTSWWTGPSGAAACPLPAV